MLKETGITLAQLSRTDFFWFEMRLKINRIKYSNATDVNFQSE